MHSVNDLPIYIMNDVYDHNIVNIKVSIGTCGLSNSQYQDLEIFWSK